MSARKAFVLGALVGAGVLAAVGAVTASSTRQSANAAGQRGQVPPSALPDLAGIDKPLDHLIALAKEGDFSALTAQHLYLFPSVHVESLNNQFIGKYLAMALGIEPGVAGDLLIVNGELRLATNHLVQVRELEHAIKSASGAEQQRLIEQLHANEHSALTYLEVARRFKEKVVKAISAISAPPPGEGIISEDDTWAHNQPIGKSNICINVRTTPPQAFISASVTGPNNYKASLPKTPLHADGTRQVGAPITQAGDYTKTLTVYDASGKETATVTKTFTVDAPPKDGPATTPPCPKPTK